MEESVRLNYEIDKLVQILNAHFEDYEFSINIIVRCLKIMSVSLRDDELRQSIENMIGRNEHNGLKIYKLFVYLCSFQKNIEGIVGKFNRECQEIMISKMLSIYLFTKEFDKKLSVQIEGILQIEVENECILKVLKNQYLGYGLPLLTLLQKIRMLKLKSKGRKLIIGLLQHCLNKSQNELLKLLREYRDNMKDIDYVLDKFPELSTLMVGKVQLLFDARTIIQYMKYVEGHRL